MTAPSSTSQRTVPTDGAGAPPASSGSGARLTVIAFALVFASMVGVVLYSALKEPHVFDPLDDATATAIRGACDDAHVGLESLGRLPDEITRAQLADRVDAENEIYDAMVTRLESMTTSDGEGQEALGGWRGDWRHVIDRRIVYSGELRDEAIERPELVLPTVRRGSLKPVTQVMDEYADIHQLDQCNTVALQVEIVEGPRNYTSGV